MIGTSSTCSPLYLEPTDLLPHTSRSRYDCVPALGGTVVALAVTVWRPGLAEPRKVVPAAAIPEWLQSLPCEERNRANRIMEHWRRSPGFAGLSPSARPALMGVLNITPDSFYAASRNKNVSEAIAFGRVLANEGAAILDVGGQSTRPGSGMVSEPRELSTVLPVVSALAKNADAILSIDTVRPRVAEAAVKAGATIVNDVSGLMPAAALGESASLIIGHMRGTPTTMQRWPRSHLGIFSLYDWLEQRIHDLSSAGISRSRIAVDPGFGFGKAVSHNRAIMQYLPLLSGLGVAIAIGLSRKASLGFISGTPQSSDRLPASLAAALTAARHGAAILRVHDVAATRQTLQISNFFS